MLFISLSAVPEPELEAAPSPEPEAAPSPEESAPLAPDAEIVAPIETTEPPPGCLHTFLYLYLHE